MDEPGQAADGRILEDILLQELDGLQRRILARVLQLNCGCTALRFMYERAREWLTVQDIAFHLQATSECVESTLEALVELGMAERREIVGIAFYGLGSRLANRSATDTLCEWQSRWQATLNRLQNLLGVRN